MIHRILKTIVSEYVVVEYNISKYTSSVVNNLRNNQLWRVPNFKALFVREKPKWTRIWAKSCEFLTLGEIFRSYLA